MKTKKFLFILILSILTTIITAKFFIKKNTFFAKQITVNNISKKNKPFIFMFIVPKNFRDEEFYYPYKLLSKYYNVEVFSFKNTAYGMLGSIVSNLKILKNINVDKYITFIFPGGSGFLNYYENKTLIDIVKKANQKNKIIVAECLAPMLLAKAGILTNKNVSVFPFEKAKILLKTAKAKKIFFDRITLDDNIITSPGPDFAKKLAKIILEKIKNGKQ